jgi:hypothetical protein
MAADLQKLADDVSYLQQDMAKVGTLVDRLDTTLEKLTDISTSVSNLLAVHEAKLTSQEILAKNTLHLVESRRVENESKIQLLHDRISSGEKELSVKIDAQYDEIMKEIKEMRHESTKQHETLSGRINTMEKLIWIVLGGAVVLGVLIDKINFSSLF